MPKPKKQTFSSEPLTGEHRVSADGTQVFIGGSVFKRTVLPSVAVPRHEDQAFNSALEDIDQTTVKKKTTISNLHLKARTELNKKKPKGGDPSGIAVITALVAT